LAAKELRTSIASPILTTSGCPRRASASRRSIRLSRMKDQCDRVEVAGVDQGWLDDVERQNRTTLRRFDQRTMIGNSKISLEPDDVHF
jgi:hypothetical protein